jgi:hypothetical protein
MTKKKRQAHLKEAFLNQVVPIMYKKSYIHILIGGDFSSKKKGGDFNIIRGPQGKNNAKYDER